MDAHRHSDAGRLPWVRRLDALGIGLSALCIVHCALTPVLILVVPFFASHEFDEVVRLGLMTLGLAGVGLGAYLHRNLASVPLLVVASSLFLTLAIFFGHEAHGAGELPRRPELLLSVLASFALMGAHALNTRACRDSEHECSPGQWFADGVWSGRDRSARGFWIALAFASGLHVALLALLG